MNLPKICPLLLAIEKQRICCCGMHEGMRAELSFLLHKDVEAWAAQYCRGSWYCCGMWATVMRCRRPDLVSAGFIDLSLPDAQQIAQKTVQDPTAECRM